MDQTKKRILYLITQSNFGGAQKYVFDLATNLDKRDFDVAVAAGGNGELFSRLGAAGIKVFELKWLRRSILNPIADLMAYFEIKKLLETWQPDVLHLNSSKISVLGALAARNLPIKVIYTVHGVVFKGSFSWLAKRFFLWAETWTAQFKHKIICVSEYDRALWQRHCVAPPEKLITIHNGIDLNMNFLPKDQARKIIFNNCALPDNCHIVGWLGYFYPEKNLLTLLTAAELLLPVQRTKRKNVIFAIIGNGQLEKELKAKVKNSGLQDKILFFGAIQEAKQYIKAFDVLTLPSTKEGLPYTIMEGMAAGVPIVASRVGGIPEMITDNFNGFLISPRDPEALAEKIMQIIENPALARQFSQNSLQRVKEFSLEKMTMQTQALY
ncbi:MAG: glycosyltransferase family 4 protein [bacterium]